MLCLPPDHIVYVRCKKHVWHWWAALLAAGGGTSKRSPAQTCATPAAVSHTNTDRKRLAPQGRQGGHAHLPVVVAAAEAAAGAHEGDEEHDGKQQRLGPAGGPDRHVPAGVWQREVLGLLDVVDLCQHARAGGQLKRWIVH